MSARLVALKTLLDIDRSSAYTDKAIDRHLSPSVLSGLDKSLATELVYGIIRRQRTLDNLIDSLGNKKAQQQPPALRRILHIGLYQLRYLHHIPESAAVNTAVELTKDQGFGKLAGVVNGILRQYLRQVEAQGDALILPPDTVSRLGIIHSFPDWLISLWLDQFTEEETEKLCAWFNQSPSIDIRINPLKTNRDEVKNLLENAGVEVMTVGDLPQTLRLLRNVGNVKQLPGFSEGLYTIQDSSAQLVGHLLDPQPRETIIDACAAPGGKTCHIAELMGDRGKVWACDPVASRLKQIEGNIKRLSLHSVEIKQGDSRHQPGLIGKGDRVLLDAPCSGLGTLHKRPDIRWRERGDNLEQLSGLQSELLSHTADWVKPEGILVYATCTLNKGENEEVIIDFLGRHPGWRIENNLPSMFTPFVTAEGWLKVLPHVHQMDGFFMVKLVKDR
ncbi:MAG: Ribosomal RNA small subunit methyltransferase B [Chroococcopsis gigantea SAG 12.99]|jgi:16S rRNA (cytosine967-C5)-methyltransferase|nr:16S rRNA (cytosine(967)-C(5))-methyltransferase [Chlorogloea purpurea SAG 13.99]MDV2998584.1 Ribosomal RNA small subunit methyltransferase B [Chroococcopsis gigantea SAG 12.99]